MKRSSCASGSGYVPSCSIGFCVARTKNGFGSSSDLPCAVTWPSCIASRSAACVLGGVRLISSARTTLAKSGPATKRKRRRPVCGSSSMISVPVMSPGMRSGVNWMRLNERSQRVRERADEERLGQAGHADEQGVAAREQRHQQPLDGLVLPDDLPGDFRPEPSGRVGELRRRRVRRVDGHAVGMRVESAGPRRRRAAARRRRAAT